MRSSFTPSAPAAATIELPPARATESLGPPGSGGSPGFASVLHDHVARTASAEGQHKTATETGGHRARQAQRTSDRTPVQHAARHTSASDDASTAATAATSHHAGLHPMVDHSSRPAGADTAAVTAQAPAGAQVDAGKAPAATVAATPTAPAAPTAATPAAAPVTVTGTVTDAAATHTDAQQATALPAAAALLQQAAVPPAAVDAAPTAEEATTPDPQTTTPQQALATEQQQAGQDPQPAPIGTNGSDHPADGQPAPAVGNPIAPTAGAATPQGQNATQQDGANPNAQDPRAALQSLLTQPPATAPGTPAQTTQTAPGAQAASDADTAPDAQAAPSAQATPPAPATQSTPAAPQPVQPTTTDTSSLNLTPAATPLASTAAPAATPAAAAARYAVPLERAVETVHLTVEAAARQGFSQARIQLSPEAFGGIKIDLQHTAEGVVAKVVTDHEAAAQTLTQGGAELKRSLEAAGVNLVSLDIEARGDSGATSRDPNHPTLRDRTGTSTRGNDGSGSSTESDDTVRATHTLVLPNGAHVNVLA